MKKLTFLLLLILIFSGCDKEDAPDCLKTTGESISYEIDVAEFEELIVYGRIRLIIEQGGEHKVVVETGKNLVTDITATVENGRLSLRNNNNCDFIRNYNNTTIYVTVPNLTWLQNAGNNTVEGIGILNFPEVWLRSLNQEKDPEIYTNGNFRLHLKSEKIRVTADNYSNFFLEGETGYLNLYIAAGDSRVEAAGLRSGTVEIQHRGTNKLFVNPQEILKGEIRSTGDVISVNRPETVDIETFYTGRLYFRAP